MRWAWWPWLLLVLVAPATAQPAQPTDPDFEARARAELADASSKAAVEMWDLGNLERARGRLQEAKDAYAISAGAAEDVDHPHRRLCDVERQLGDVENAIKECRRAVELRPQLAFNKIALARALATRNHDDDRREAVALAREVCATRADPASCAARVLDVEPADPWGAPDTSTANTASTATTATTASAAGPPSPIWHIAWIVGLVLGSWLAGMFLLLGAGYWLSRVTLRALTDLSGVAGGGRRERRMREQRLRRLYRVVLTICGIYFYLSLPIVLVVVTAAGAGATLVFLAAGYIPIKLFVVIGGIVVLTIGAVGQSLLLRVRDEPPGAQLPLADHPRLRALIVDVATTIGTRPADTVYLTPGTDMAVTERLGLWRSVRHGRTQRSLIMGVALFDGMTQLQLRSVLAHEHGHFRNEDTAGGGFAIQVRRSLVAMIVQLAQSGVAGAFNPAWWFLRGYFRIYLGVSQGASRLQEVLADRWAIQAYGSAAFVAGYRHTVARSVEFDPRAEFAVAAAIENKLPLANLYAARVEFAAEARAALAAEIEKQMTREPDIYDSHPSSQQRLEWAEAMHVARDPKPDDDEPVWALFADRDAIERAMTAVVRERLRARHGVELQS